MTTNKNRAAFGMALAIFLTACSDGERIESETAVLEKDGLAYLRPADAPAMQAMASQACDCARDKADNDREACWADFNAAIKRYHHYEEASACGPTSSSYVVFEQPGGDEGSYPVVHHEFAYGACTAKDGKARMAEQEKSGQPSFC